MTRSISRRFMAGAATLALCAAAAGFTASQAGAGSPMVVVNPTTVTAGDQITVSQSCARTSVTVGVYEGWNGPFVTPTTEPIINATDISPDVANQWTVKLTIPVDTAPGSYTVDAQCTDPENEPWDYGAVELTVLPAPTPSTTTSTTTTTTAPPNPETKAATAVNGTPTYTG